MAPLCVCVCVSRGPAATVQQHMEGAACRLPPKLIGVNDGVICTIARSETGLQSDQLPQPGGLSRSAVCGAYNNKLSASCCNWEILRHYRRQRGGRWGDGCACGRRFQGVSTLAAITSCPIWAAIPPLITNSPKWNVCSAANWQLCCCCW